jgi:hypothetical protein
MTEMMQSASSKDDFPFLTEARVNALEKAIHICRQEVALYRQNNATTYAAMQPRGQADVRRAIYISVLTQVMREVDGVTFRSDRGGFYIVFDQDTVLHAKRLNRKTLLAWIPKALQPVVGPKTMPMEGFINEENVPLYELRDFIAGFVEDRFGQLIGFYLTEQNGHELVSQLPFEVSQTLSLTQLTGNDTAVIPEVKFKARKKAADNESTGS